MVLHYVPKECEFNIIFFLMKKYFSVLQLIFVGNKVIVVRAANGAGNESKSVFYGHQLKIVIIRKKESSIVKQIPCNASKTVQAPYYWQCSFAIRKSY